MGKIFDGIGTRNVFWLIRNFLLKEEADGIGIQNKAGTQYENLHCAQVLMKGDTLTFNDDSTDSGNDWSVTLERNAAQTQTVSITLPANLPPETRKLLMSSTGNLIFAGSVDGDLASLNAGQLLLINGSNLDVDFANQTDKTVPEDTDVFAIYTGTGYRKLSWLNLKNDILSQTGTGLEYQGTFDPNGPTPNLTNGTGTQGDWYIASADGTHDFGSGAEAIATDDWIIYAADGTWKVNGNPVTAYTSDDITDNSTVTAGGTVTEALDALNDAISAQSGILKADIAFDSAAEISFSRTIPTNALVHRITYKPNTPFNGTATFSVGIDGNTTKYQPASGVEAASLTDGEYYDLDPESAINSAEEQLKVFYTAGGATQGSGQVRVFWGVVE